MSNAGALTAMPKGHVTFDRITCPYCGGTGPFRYLEDIVCWREVRGQDVDKNMIATVKVNGLYKSGEGYDDGENPRLECHAAIDDKGNECLGQFIPVDHNGEPVEFEFE